MTSDSIVRRTLRFTLCSSAIFLLSVSTASASAARHCSDALSVNLDETLRGEGSGAGEPACFRLETPAAGLLMLDLAMPLTAAAEPHLGLLDCAREAAGLRILEQSASHLLVASDAPRVLTVCAGAQDPRHELGEFKLSTAFAELDRPVPQRSQEVEVDPDPFAGGCQKSQEVEVDPDPFTGGCHKSQEVEVDPDPFAGGCHKSQEVEVDPDPFAGSLDALCAAADLDDHADNLLCATALRLGDSVRGEIANGWGDDHDVFVFELTGSQTVEIVASGELETFSGIYDRRGQRLAASNDEGGGFRLVKTLPEGLYFVRVEATAWSEGTYDLALSAVERSW